MYWMPFVIRKFRVTTEILDVVLQAVDYLEEMVMDIASGGTGKKDVRELVESLNRIEAGGAAVMRQLKLRQLLYLKIKSVRRVALQL